MTRTCGQLYAGNTPTGAYNLAIDCPEHGIESEWYKSDEQVEKRQRQNERLRELQLQAREARKNAKLD